ncbi:hypothetical protein BDV96DRAFT_650644 [Lophiotrema nucula]|uniref:Uncharacterized protein n=1 Tax=Lophiotrema nucula TaxID=690887 RepID=A0A6A5YV84_9PLEO|nr:hypothetical protein BDV96DRAFT_650644 [Lophiotrema nucula]
MVEIAVSIRSALLDERNLDRINSYSNHGLIYLSKGQYDQALKRFQACAQIRKTLYEEKVMDVDYVAASYLNMGMAYTLMMELDNARDALTKVRKLIGPSFEFLKSLVLFWEGNIAIAYDDWKVAKSSFEEAYEIICRIHSETSIQRAAVKTCTMRDECRRSCKSHALEITVYRGIDGEQARASRLKALLLKNKVNPTREDASKATSCMKTAEDILARYKDVESRSDLSEDDKYSLLICGQRR